MSLETQIRNFSDQYGKNVIINNKTWRYYKLGTGAPVLWLTGGLRRAALGFAFMEQLAKHHTVLAPDYPPVKTPDEFITAFDMILQTEGITTFTLAGQSYGGLLAQAYLAHKGNVVEQLILTSTGPITAIGKVWLPVMQFIVLLARLLPEKKVKQLLAGGLLKIITVRENERAAWLEVIQSLIQNELSRADVISHFAVSADIIKSRTALASACKKWTGRITVLSADNDPTQDKKDFPQYEKLFGRPVKVMSLGSMGHTAALFDPEQFVTLLEEALA